MLKPKIFSVSQINRYIKGLLENDIILQSFWINGEISNYKLHSSGHIYFTLKDKNSALNCIMFKDMASLMPYTLENGMSVNVCGYISLYEKTGQYQLYAQIVSPEGVGELAVAFEQLKNKLAGEGLFDEDFKRSLPQNPSTIGVITSPTGAAVRDIINISLRRNPGIKIKIFPVLVQGENAAPSIVEALKTVNALKACEVIILGRGGGSMEDLWAFNEESVARAIFASEIPVISAVGHETDFTIADFVSDLRAPTPSAAAELAVADVSVIYNRFFELSQRLDNAVFNLIKHKNTEFEILIDKNVFKRPLDNINNFQIYCDELENRLNREINLKINNFQSDFVNFTQKLNALSPLAVLSRGYCVVNDENGKIIKSASDVSINQNIDITTDNGLIKAVVKDKVM